jgi:hypothetical protein
MILDERAPRVWKVSRTEIWNQTSWCALGHALYLQSAKKQVKAHRDAQNHDDLPPYLQQLLHDQPKCFYPYNGNPLVAIE